MILAKIHELGAMHSGLGRAYNRNAARMLSGDVMQDHDQPVVDQLMIEYGLEQHWEFKPAAVLSLLSKVS